jgi:hypothetical protein
MENLATGPLALAAHGQALSVLFNNRFGEGLEVSLYVWPLEVVPAILQAPVEFLF